MDLAQLKKLLDEAKKAYAAALPWYRKLARPEAAWFAAGFAVAKLVSCLVS